MDIGFMLVSDKKFGLYGKNQRNPVFFSGFRWFLTEILGEIYPKTG
jgi:hypothetical protein